MFALAGLAIAADAEPVEPTTFQLGVPPETVPVRLNATVPCGVWHSDKSAPAAAVAEELIVACFDAVVAHPAPPITVTPNVTLPEPPAVQTIALVP